MQNDFELIKKYQDHEFYNLTPNITKKIGTHLHLKKDHPINIIKKKLEDYFKNWAKDSGYTIKTYDNLSPFVTTQKAFDELLIPLDHKGRQATDTYYLNNEMCLRPHTSAHQTEIIKSGETSFLVTGDVFRKDTIDGTHFPVFHQMEGVHLYRDSDLEGMNDEEKKDYVIKGMKDVLQGMAQHLFGNIDSRWNPDYFPFTDPSFELEIYYKNQWLEVLGCGMVHQQIVKDCNLHPRRGWAFGLGLERLAMILFEIPDIRLFWSEDQRFLSQFKEGKDSKFKSYSKFPPCTKDISFFVPENFHEHSFYDLVRDITGDLVESVTIVDKFQNPKNKKWSYCFRIIYRSMDKSLTNEEVNEIQENVRDLVVKQLKVELR